MGLANISIVGNVVKPPSQTQFPSGNSKTTIMVAVDGPKKGDENTEFYKVEAWGKLGDIAQKYIGKGQQITAVGRFNIDRWQDKEGRERITPTINASQISLPPRRAWDDTSSTTPHKSSFASSPSKPSPPPEFQFSEEDEDAAAAAMFGASTVVHSPPELNEPTGNFSASEDSDLQDVLNQLEESA
jgi:single-strand DNA-binding protein